MDIKTANAPLVADPDFQIRLIGENEAAAFLGFSPRALQNWRLRGGGPNFIKISIRSVRYRRRDLAVWVNQRVRSSTSDPGGATPPI